MNNPTIAQIKDMIAQSEPQIAEAEDLIRFLKQAGENTAKQETELSKLKLKVENYRKALMAQGLA